MFLPAVVIDGIFYPHVSVFSVRYLRVLLLNNIDLNGLYGLV
jgi:hypothetical protein